MCEYAVRGPIYALGFQDGNPQAFNGCGLTAVPAALGQLRQLAYLDLSGNQIVSVDGEAFENLTMLTTLDLSSNQITAVPEAFENLTMLTSLLLSRNQIPAVPTALGRLRQLQSLDLSANRLSAFPDAAKGSFAQLTTLLLSGNLLRSLPDSIDSMTQLQDLEVDNNRIQTLPRSLSKCKNLVYLYVSQNELTGALPALGDLDKLQQLQLSNNWNLGHLPEQLPPSLTLLYANGCGLKNGSLPESLGNLSHLTTLWVRDNELQELPPAVRRLEKLQSLDAENISMRTLPAWIGNLRDLDYLLVSGNGLTEIPPDVGKLSSLTELNVANNRLVALPSTLSKCTRLLYLRAGDNQITSIDDNFTLDSVQNVHLGNNRLVQLPATKSILWPSLTTLNVSGNELQRLPDWIGRVASLGRLELQDNLFQALPPWTCASGNGTLSYIDASNNRLRSLPHDFSSTTLTHFYVRSNPLEETASSLAALAARTTRLRAFGAGGSPRVDNTSLLRTFNLDFSKTAPYIGKHIPGFDECNVTDDQNQLMCGPYAVIQRCVAGVPCPFRLQFSDSYGVAPSMSYINLNMTVSRANETSLSAPLVESSDGYYDGTIPADWISHPGDYEFQLWADGPNLGRPTKFYAPNDPANIHLCGQLEYPSCLLEISFEAFCTSAHAVAVLGDDGNPSCGCQDSFQPTSGNTTRNLKCTKICDNEAGETTSATGDSCVCAPDYYNATLVGAIGCVDARAEGGYKAKGTMGSIKQAVGNINKRHPCTQCSEIASCATCCDKISSCPMVGNRPGAVQIRQGYRTNATDATALYGQLQKAAASHGSDPLLIFKCPEMNSTNVSEFPKGACP
eukprot:SAG31_NODE_1700_length_7499_cov_2.107973_6_plen_846_part_01